MKRILLTTLTILMLANIAFAAPLGRASADFDNARPQKVETAFGRLAADAIRAATGADVALINAGAFKAGVLRAGEVSASQINALFSFPGDDIATITITGAQLRAALERAVQAYPTGSPAFLHGSGYTATFNTQAPTNDRLTMLRINGREVQNGDSISVAMPTPLVSGNSGYFTIWPDAKATRTKISLSDAIGALFKARGTIAPDEAPRLAPQ
jgi:2',3'-cyclic-nucleotide 2'-phosphodiesterase (5'-nucleotidase family)